MARRLNPTIVTDPIGPTIRALRERAKLSQDQVAKRMRRESSGLSRYERGLRQPGRDDLLAFAEAIRLPAADTDRLLALAGYASEREADADALALATVLNDKRLPTPARRQAREVVRALVALLNTMRQA